MKTVTTDFSRGSVRALVLAQAIPLTLAQGVQLLYNIVDRVYIGHLEEVGELALTGLGVAFPVAVIISAFTGLCSAGGATLFAIARGRGEEDEAERILGTVCTMLLGAAALLFLLFSLFRGPVLYLFGASDQSFPYANEYLRLYLLGTPFTMFATGLNSFINAQGFPRMGMVTTTLGAVLNIILDPIFIFGLDLGVSGAALATVISQGVSALWVLGFLTGRRAILRLKRSCFGVQWRRARSILVLGVPHFIMLATNSLVTIVCNNQLQRFGGSLGDLYVSIMTVINSVRELASLPVSGISQGTQPVLGYNYGAGQLGRVKETIRFSALLGLGYTALTWLLVLAIPELLIAIFTDDPATITLGARMMNLYFFGFIFMSFQFAGQCTFQALGKAKYAVFFSMLRKAFIVVPLTVWLPTLGLGVNGVFLAEPISNALGGLACFLTMYITLYRKL